MKHESYLKSIISGKVNHGKHIRMLCEQLHREMHDDNFEYYFDEETALKYIRFIERLSLTEGKWAGQPFTLQPWQAFIITNIFGWKHKETGLRRYDEVTIHVPKKNGKTAMVAALTLAYAFLEKEDYAGQIYTAATN